MAFKIHHNGIEISVDTLDELKGLLPYLGILPPPATRAEVHTKIDAANSSVASAIRMILGVQIASPSAEWSLEYALDQVRHLANHVPFARTVREALGIAKPHEAEWTYEHAIDMIKGLMRYREGNPHLAFFKGDAHTPGKLAELAVYTITKSWPSVEGEDGQFYRAWMEISQKRRAELVTLWIEAVEAKFKATQAIV